MEFIFSIAQIVAIISIVFSLITILKKSIFEIIPFLYSIILILMYVLSFFNHMELISYMLIIGGLISLVYNIIHKKDVINYKIPRAFWIWFAAVFLGGWFLSSRLFTAFDEYNFWAPSVKSLFYLNGFSLKGFEPVLAFGDYPLISQIAECLPCYIKGGFDAGLTMTGFYIFGMIYTLAIVTYFPKKASKIWYILLFIFLMLFGSWGSDMWFSRSPDILMAIVYGYSLTIALRDESKFNLVEFILSLSVLALVKSVGIQWVIFSIIFWILMHKKSVKNFLIPLLGTVTYVSWSIFCLVNERTTYLTTNLIDNVSGKVTNNELLSHVPTLIEYFFKALFSPLTGESVVLKISLSWAAILMLFTILAIIIKKVAKTKPDKKIANIVIVFIFVTGIVELGILLYSVLTMFIGEYGNYENIDNMKMLLQRYGSPILLGSYILLICYGAKIIGEDTIIDVSIKNKSLIKSNSFKLVNLFWYMIIIIGIISSPISKQVAYYTGYSLITGKINNTSIETSDNYELLSKAANKLHVANYGKVVLIQTSGENKAFGLNYLSAPVSIRYEFISVNDLNLDIIKEKLNYYNTDLFYIYDEKDGIVNSNLSIKYNQLYSLKNELLKEVN